MPVAYSRTRQVDDARELNVIVSITWLFVGTGHRLVRVSPGDALLGVVAPDGMAIEPGQTSRAEFRLVGRADSLTVPGTGARNGSLQSVHGESLQTDGLPESKGTNGDLKNIVTKSNDCFDGVDTVAARDESSESAEIVANRNEHSRDSTSERRQPQKEEVLSDYALKVIRFKAWQLSEKAGFSRSNRTDLEQKLWTHLVGRASAHLGKDTQNR